MNLITTPIPASFRDRSIYTTNNSRAFAALKTDGSVVTWGAINQETRAAVQALINTTNPAVSLYESGNGFAAIKSDGSAVLWVNSTDFSYANLPPMVVGDAENPVISISSDVNGFAGIYKNGKAFLFRGNEISEIFPSDQSTIVQICASAWGFAFVSNTGKILVVTSAKDLNYSQPIEYEFPKEQIVRIFAGEYDYYGLSSSGNVYKIGGGGPAELEAKQTSPVVNIANNNFAFAAIHLDGTVTVWGDPGYGYFYGADVPDRIREELNKGGVVAITPSVGAFAALKSDGSIFAWGHSQWLYNSTNNIDFIYRPEDESKEAVEIVSSWTTFAARLKDGSVISFNGYPSPDEYHEAILQEENITKLVATSGDVNHAGGFAALTSSGKVITFGDTNFGGDSSSVADKISSNVIDIFANGSAFAALKTDGSVVSWGTGWGGDSSMVANELSSGIATLASYHKTNLLFLSGTDSADKIIGGSESDVLLGQSGDDLIYGGTGADFVVGGSGADGLFGDFGSDILYGGDGNDTVYAGLGDDLIIGGDGKGNDKYYGGAGADTVKYTSATWGITVDLTRGTAASLSNQAIRGNRDAANIGADRLYEIENVTAGNYNDVLSGNHLANEIKGEDGDDRIDGKSGNDVLYGGDGNDSLTGGAGADVMAGGAGDDVYDVDSLSDTVTELSGQGVDLIRTTLSHIDLIDYDHVENLTYTGRSNSTLIGSDIDNVIRGGSRNDVIQGGFGSDTLYGGDGTDLLYGFYENYGNDASYGGDIDERLEAERLIPPDVLRGGKGNDIYIGGGDRGNEQQIVELKNEGVDIIFGAYTEYVLPDNVENYCNVMVQIDVSAPYFEIVGNSLNNLIQSSPDWSSMPEQSDVDAELQWYLKNFNTNKFLSTVNSNPDIAIERFFGMAGNDTLLGGAGDDYLSGGIGRDRLTGGTGADKFVFDTTPNSRTNADTITDFRGSDGDELGFDDEVFTVLSGSVSDDNLRINRTGQAQDADDFLILNSTNGKLFYDADGNGRGAAIEVVTLTGVNTLSHDVFLSSS